mgnify:CR=1 FL=1|jgi:hypothetical protein
MTKEPFRIHMKEIVEDYSNIHIVDLLQDKRDREVRLTKEYYKLFFDSDYKKSDKLKYCHFDFHRFCKGDKFDALKVLISQLIESINFHGQFILDLSTGGVLAN